jgi:hypothetical protein
MAAAGRVQFDTGLAEPAILRLEGRNFHLDQRRQRDIDYDVLFAPVDDDPETADFCFKGFDQGDHFAEGGASREDIVDEQYSLALLETESAADREAALLALRENVASTKSAGDFMSEEHATHRWRDHGVDPEFVELFGEQATDIGGQAGELEQSRALEVSVAVAPAAELEVTFEQRADFAHAVEDF